MSIFLNNHIVEFIEFPNKEKRLDLNPDLIKDHKNKVMFVFEDNSSIFDLLLFDSVMDQLDVEYNLFIPYMPYSRMDRINDLHTAFSLEVFGDLLKKLHYNKLEVLDAHSSETYRFTNADEFPYSIHYDVLSKHDLSNCWVVFPDKGAQKRYDVEDYPNVIVCEKVRDFQTGQIKSIEAKIERGNANGQLFIIDDLCSRGGTFIGCLKAIDDLNIAYKQANLIVTHAENAMLEGQILDTFDHVYCTDSISGFGCSAYRYLSDKLNVTELRNIYFGGN